MDVGSARGSVRGSAEPEREQGRQISKNEKLVLPCDGDMRDEGRDLNLAARIKSENLKLRELYF